MSAQPPHELRLELPAAHSAEREARRELCAFARRWKLPRREVEVLEFVAGELLSNAVDHGAGRATGRPRERPPARTRLELALQATGWTLRVSDQGGGDLEQVRRRLRPQGPPDLEDERGRGFYLLGQLLESLDVARGPSGVGLEFVAVRRYPAASEL